VIALLVALLALGRFRPGGELGDLLLTASFMLLALVNLVFTTIPAVVSDLPNDTTTWGAVGGVGIKHRTKHRYADRARSARSARAAVPSTRRGPGRRRPGAASMPVGLPAHPREVC
jgi:hypothetical protein